MAWSRTWRASCRREAATPRLDTAQARHQDSAEHATHAHAQARPDGVSCVSCVSTPTTGQCPRAREVSPGAWRVAGGG